MLWSKTQTRTRGLARYYHLAVNFWCDYYHEQASWCNVAIAVHMRCWDLTERTFGLNVNNHLSVFLAATLQVAVKRGLPTWLEMEIGRQGEWEFNMSRRPGLTIQGGEIPKTPPNNRLVQKALKQQHKQKYPNKDSWLPSNCLLCYLPLDVAWLLFNCLDYYYNPWNLVNAVQFPIPDRHWRRRANAYLDLMDDVNELELDWPYLCLALGMLHAILGIFTTRIWVINDIDRLNV